MSKDIRKITEGSMIVALLGVLFIIDRQSAGILNYIIAWVVPLPFVIYTAKHGIKDALVPFVASVFVSIMLSSPVFFVFTIMYGLIGIVYGYGVHKKWQSRYLFFATVVGTSIVFFVTIILFSAFFGYSIVEDMDMFYQVLDMVEVPPNVNVQQVVTSSLVVMYSTSVILEAYFIHMISKVVLTRFKIVVAPSKAIESVSFPRWSGWVMLGSLFIYPISRSLSASEAIVTATFAIYAWIVILLLYQAFVFVIIVQRRYKRKFLLVTVVFALLLLPTLMIDVLMIIGLLDILSDMRSKITGVNNHA